MTQAAVLLLGLKGTVRSIYGNLLAETLYKNTYVFLCVHYITDNKYC